MGRQMLAFVTLVVGVSLAPGLAAQTELTDLDGPLVVPTVTDAPCGYYCDGPVVVCRPVPLLMEPSPDAALIDTLPRGEEVQRLTGRRFSEPGIVVVQREISSEEVETRFKGVRFFPWMPPHFSGSWAPGDTIFMIAWVSDGDGRGATLIWTGSEYASVDSFWPALGRERADSPAVIETLPQQTYWLQVERVDGSVGWVQRDREALWIAGHYQSLPRCAAP